MKRSKALWLMRQAAATRAVRFSAHALTEADVDGVAPDHVLHAMQHLTFAVEQRGGTYAVATGLTWRCKGPDGTGRTIGFVAALEDGVLVVTVYEIK
jgi:hypothetical protein